MCDPLCKYMRLAMLYRCILYLWLIFVFAGVGIAVITGTVTGAQPNNGLVIATNSQGNFRFVCRTNSTEVGEGELIGPIGGGSFVGTTSRAGELNIVGSLVASEQGVYTCRMPFEDDGVGEINIGIYPNGFISELICWFINK